jgi:hypothetical protein
MIITQFITLIKIALLIIVTIILPAHVVGGLYTAHIIPIVMKSGVCGAMDGNMMENIVIKEQNNMKVIILGFLFLSLCVGCSEVISGSSSGTAETTCHNESPLFQPYTYPAPEHCDIFDSGRCCSYYTSDVNARKCYEEWCIWDEDCGWEYEGEFCPIDTNEIENK